jgi:hypothetical protein
MEYVTPRNVNQWKYRWEHCSVWFRADSDVMQQLGNCGKRCFLLAPSRGYVARTNGTSQSGSLQLAEEVVAGSRLWWRCGRRRTPIVVSRCVVTTN